MTEPHSGHAPVPARPAPLRVVLGVGGGIAAYKAALVSRLLSEAGHHVVPMPTRAALEFVGAPTWEALTGEHVSESVFDRVDTVNHVAQGQAADLVVIAPATADLMARIAHGHADDLLSTTVLATSAPVFLAPAMHTEMWLNPATQRNVALLREHGHTVMEPATGRLTGTDSGPGRLPEPQDIVDAALALAARTAPSCAGPSDAASIGSASTPDAASSTVTAAPAGAPTTDHVGSDPGVLAGRRVLVTAGGTREALDPVRFLGNRSSGKQGVALARAARDAGADVHLIAAHVETDLPQGMRTTRVSSARELEGATLTAAAESDVVIMAAAVADFRPDAVGEHKMKKSEDGTDPVIRLVRNPDILRAVVAQRDERGLDQLVVGFAAETGDAEHSVLDFGRAKLARKGCDLLVLNEVGTDKVFGRDENEVVVLSARGAEEASTRGSKDEVARFVVERIAREEGVGAAG
ncbi:bifunctional phosphopantothenoylcysteine decarboxylase/phosphopantothenate synthase [Kocuria rhizophila]|uniref:bifunctional phosphopantothenoylcysteine decarboxylase/phosphopantothenate synthase n=1 Tax=Kocuria rhizophila TaxID=72000 RepID=UPI0021A5DAE8|nr:bifunctional phosphopantothenoylcysteine decarboxylase/phosphopantothenate synthase [Kocuria rhizophila]MCT1879414.1 bifunctional phosphopantothenoylcysteine decarboxylase/phosphopantothenate synthase [Kocuria rhizophila]